MDIRELLSIAADDIEDLPTYLGNVNDAFNLFNDGQVALLEQAQAESAEWKKKYEETAAKNYELIMAETGTPEDNGENSEGEEKSLEDIVAENLKED